MKKSLPVLAAVFLVLAVSSGAFAAKGLLTGADIENGSLTGSDIKEGSLGAALFASSAKSSLRGVTGSRGTQGVAGIAGSNGGSGADGIRGLDGANGRAGMNGADGTNGLAGINGADGTNGLAGINGADGTNGLAGINGADGTSGTNGLAGINGADGTNGTNGANGTVTPLSATAGLVTPIPLPTAAPPTVVVFLDVPAGKYVILAKAQLAHTGAGDSIHCDLKADTAVIDQINMKTLPALAAVPVSLQAITTVTSSSRLSVECAVLVASGTAAFSSLIAIPTN
jgi:Collagen triple helix repeat (20 copies)